MDQNSRYSRRKDVILSPRQIEGLIAEGHSVLIVDEKVFKADAWLDFHPGGDKAILHMVGRDATDEFNALHSIDARQRLESYQIGRIDRRWENLIPPIRGGTFQALIDDVSESESEIDSDTTITSYESSRSPSPVFDIDTSRASSKLRKCAVTSDLKATSSISSLSSMGSAPRLKSEARLSHLDARTQQEINLDLSKYPALDHATQDAIVKKYRLLNQRIRDAGLYECRYTAYAYECARNLLLFTISLVLLKYSYYTLSGIFLGLFWHQLVFTAHDAGHMGITHSFRIDTTIGIIIADFLGGLSLGWWKRSHNVHHIVTNEPEHDPDIEHMPFFAISHRFFTSLRSTYYDRLMPFDALARFAVRYQAYAYYPLLALGRFNLYVLSWKYLLSRTQAPRRGPAAWTRKLELAGQLFFWTWFGYGILYASIPTWPSRIAFVLASHLITGPLHVQITLSHFAMSTADLGPRESFPQKMLRTTMDVACPPFLDFLHGGLQFQAVHHLFPRVPRHNLRKAQGLVREFCEETGIPYAVFGFVDGNKRVLGRLEEVGRQARIWRACQREVAQKGGLGH